MKDARRRDRRPQCCIIAGPNGADAPLRFFDNSAIEPGLVFASKAAGIRVVQLEEHGRIVRRADT